MRFSHHSTKLSTHWVNYFTISLLTSLFWVNFFPSVTLAQTLNRPTREIETEIEIEVKIVESWIKEELYFGRGLPSGGMISDEQWQEFVDETIAPRFPDGFSILDISGYYRNTREQTKLLIILHQNTPEVERSLREIIDRYKQQFEQESVLRVRDRVHVQF